MKTLEARLADLSLANLATVYNLASERQITKFADKTTAVKRTLMAVQAKGMDFAQAADGSFSLVAPEQATAPVTDADLRAITVLVDNPKRKTTDAHKRFAAYKTGMTVAQYVAKVAKLGGGRRKAIRDVDWDVKHGFISVA